MRQVSPSFHCAAAGLLFVLLLSIEGANGDYSPTLGNYTQYVDPFIGSGGVGYGMAFENPGAQVPFGAMRLGPDTRWLGMEPIEIPVLNYGGYLYSDKYLESFSHTHLVGGGCADFQNFGVMVTREWKENIVTEARYRSVFSHEDEIAVPGYYAATLQTPQTRAEVTVSGTHGGIHRYTCKNASSGLPCFLLVDVCHTAATSGNWANEAGSACLKAQIMNISLSQNDTVATVTAWMWDKGQFGGPGVPMYFHGMATAVGATSGTSYPFSAGMWMDNKILSSLSYELTTSKSLGAGFGVVMPSSAPAEDVVITLRSGLSFISTENAQSLLLEEQLSDAGQWISFDDAQVASTNKWESLLSRIDVLDSTTGLPSGPLKTFYTAAYHSHCAPTTYTELGTYLGLDNKVHSLPDNQTEFMSDLSIWDVYRTQMPLLTLTSPTRFRNTVWSMLQMYRETGELPKWILASEETGAMVGHHSAVIMSDAVRKAVKGLDVDAVFDALVHGIRQQNQDNLLPDYYTVFNPKGNTDAASETLDYALDAGSVVALAQFLRNQSVIDEFTPFAEAFKNVWSNETLLFCPRDAAGNFSCPTPPTIPYPFEVPSLYTEGDAVEYRWYVPHNIRQLVSLFPSPDVYAQKLYWFFTDAHGWVFGNALPNPQFWAGNEPDLLAPAMFPYAGNRYAYLTSELFPQLLQEYYPATPAGLPGNDDYGTMSAWCLFGYLGIYPVASTNEYVLFAPQFERSSISITEDDIQFSPWNRGGKIIEIVAHNHPGPFKAAYLANASVNGVSLDSPIVSHETLLGSGNGTSTIDLYLTSVPVVFGQPTPSQGGPQPFIPEPGSSLERNPSNKEALAAVGDFLQKALEGKKDGKIVLPSRMQKKDKNTMATLFSFLRTMDKKRS